MRVRFAVLVGLLLLGGWSCSRDPNVAKQKYLESGNRYFQKGKLKEAAIMYRNALRKDPKFGEAYYRLGLNQLQMGQQYWLEAVRALRRAVETLNKPELQADARVKLADVLLAFYLADRRRSAVLHDEIDELAKQLLARDPKSVDGLRVKGFLLLRGENKVKEAIVQLRQAQQIKPFEPAVVLGLVQALLSDGQEAEAEAMGKELIQRATTFAPMYDLLLQHYVRTNRPDQAEGILKLKVANHPRQSWPLIQLASFYARASRREDMQAALQQLTSNPKNFPDAYRRVGDFYLALREFDTAIRHYEQGVKADPKEATTLRLLMAEAMLAQGRRGDATRVVDQVLKEKPNHDVAKAMRASLLIDPAHPEQVRTAVTELQGLVSRMPKNAVLRFNLARALAARGEVAQTRTQLEEAVKIDPSYLPPRLALTRFHLVRGEFTQALEGAKQVLELEPRNLDARLLRAQALVSSGNFPQARQELEETLARVPNLPDAVLQLGYLNVREKKFKEAEEIFLKMHGTNPGDLRAVLGLSDVYALQGQYEKSIELLKAELARQPERLDLAIGVANLQVRAGKFDDAIAGYQKVLERNPKSSELHIQIGDTCRLKGDLPSAVAYFRKAKDLSPNDPRSYVPLGVLLDTLGQRAEAKTIYEQVLKLQPDQPVVLNNLAFILAETGQDLDQALTLAQRARQKLPQDPNVADTLGWVYIKKNLSDNAIEILRELVGKLPRNPTYRYHLGMALYQKGDKLSARKELQAALQSKPAPDEAAKIKDLLAKLG